MKNDREYNIMDKLTDSEFRQVLTAVYDYLQTLHCIFGNTIADSVIDLYSKEYTFSQIDMLLELDEGDSEHEYKARYELVASCIEAALIDVFGEEIEAKMPMFMFDIDIESILFKEIDKEISSRSKNYYRVRRDEEVLPLFQ